MCVGFLGVRVAVEFVVVFFVGGVCFIFVGGGVKFVPSLGVEVDGYVGDGGVAVFAVWV